MESVHTADSKFQYNKCSIPLDMRSTLVARISNSRKFSPATFDDAYNNTLSEKYNFYDRPR